MLSEVKERFGAIEGRRLGTVDRGKLAERLAYWKSKAIRRVLKMRSASQVHAASEVADKLADKKKGDLSLLHDVHGQLMKYVRLDVASRFGGVTMRAIQKAASKGSLSTRGTGRNRKVLVDSLIKYFADE
jgi:hypothetical protein